MNAIVNKYGIPQAALMHLQAGGDMPMICGNRNIAKETVHFLEENVALGKLSLTRIEESLARILFMKARLQQYRREGLSQFPYVPQEASKKIARSALTLVRDPRHLLSLRSGCKILLILPRMINMTMSDTTENSVIDFENFLKKYSSHIHTEHIFLNIPDKEIARICTLAKRFDIAIQCMYGSLVHKKPVKLVCQLEKIIPVIAVLIREPYDAAILPLGTTVICTYSAIAPCMEAAAEALFGEIGMPGSLPVDIDGDKSSIAAYMPPRLE
jgi:beta-N-acetylhexosaminidase